MIRLFSDIVRQFQRRKLLTWATALSYNALWALPPLVLLLLALAGYLNLEASWKQHLGPQVRSRVTPPTWTAINATADRILAQPHAIWLAIGGVLAVWHVSGLVRAAAGALNSIFGREENRDPKRRIGVAVGLAVPMTVLIVVAFGAVLGGALVRPHGVAATVAVFAARWLAAVLALYGMLALLVRRAPVGHPRTAWVTVGAGLAIGGWVATSLVFTAYVRWLADFRSPYGNLISVMVLLAYLYVLSIVFLGGVLADVVLAERTRKR